VIFRVEKWLIMGLCLGMLVVGEALAEDQCREQYGKGPNKFSLATGSPGELGLLKALAEAFDQTAHATMCWKMVGSGEALKLLKDKQVDMIMVHAPVAEKKAVADGWAVKRTLIGSNEFFIVGPPQDSAKISEARTAVEAYTRIAAAKALFLSRGDNSGTHKKELEVWKNAGVAPAGEWYLVTNDFMKATLKKANDNKGYFMTDSSTWVAEKNHVPALKILFRGDKFLVNTYHALCQPPGATPGAAVAAQFIDFVASKQGQEIIRDFGKTEHGDGLYNDAEYAKKYDE
jgi:tungstate transport system substrate-binding protein